MSEGKRRRRKGHVKRGLPRVSGVALDKMVAHPGRMFLAVLFSLFLGWAVLTATLPYVLAAAGPDQALALNPNNPVALVARAEQVREQLLSYMGTGAVRLKKEESGAQETASVEKNTEVATIARLPKAQEAAAGDEAGRGGLREKLREQIRLLAAKTIANDPLNAAAYRLLAEVAADPEHVRGLMREAVKRSRRETAAVFWLLNDSYYARDFPRAIEYADILLRTRPEMASYSFSYLLNMARDPGGRRLAANWLAEEPRWRHEFLASLWDLVQRDQIGPALIEELRNTKRPAETAEIAQYMAKLARNGALDVAYNLWVQSLPRERADNLGFLTDPGFEEEPAGSKTDFDWAILGGDNVDAGFVPSGRPGRQRLLHLTFGQGRIEMPDIQQVLLLPPGHYRLEGQLRGSIAGKRGLRWRIICVTPPQTVLGETEMLMGETEEWRVFTLEATVPQSGECVGQLLRLYHEARSPSEEYLSGEAWFGGMRLERVSGPKSARAQ